MSASWNLNQQYVQQCGLVLEPSPKGFRVDWSGAKAAQFDSDNIARWLYQKAFEIASVGYCPPDDLYILFGQDMLSKFAPLSTKRELVVQTHKTEEWYILPQKFILTGPDQPKIELFRGTSLDQAGSIVMLYMPWVRGWCFFTIPQPVQTCLINALPSDESSPKELKNISPKPLPPPGAR